MFKVKMLMIDNNSVHRLVIEKMLHQQDRLDTEDNGQLYSHPASKSTIFKTEYMKTLLVQKCFYLLPSKEEQCLCLSICLSICVRKFSWTTLHISIKFPKGNQ